jgi:hypothetical protein
MPRKEIQSGYPLVTHPSPPLAWLLVAFVTAPNGSIASTFVPGIATPEACHHLAVNLNVPNHQCISYPVAVTTDAEAEANAEGDADDGIDVLGPIIPTPRERPKPTPEKPVAAPVAAPAPKPAQRCGTLFGHLPNDGKGQPINELLCDIRGAIFMTFVWPHVLAAVDAHLKAAAP